MEGLPLGEAALLMGGGLVAGVVNTLAGGGSLLTVPLLVLLGLPGGLANGTNRVGVLFQSIVAAWRFRSHGVLRGRDVLPIFVPVACGSVLGAVAVSTISDTGFQHIFGLLMLLLVVPTLRGIRTTPSTLRHPRPIVAALALLIVGVYAGAFQAGVGIPLLFTLLQLGHDAVRANALKVTIIALSTLAAVPVFAWNGQIAWTPALVLAAGFTVGAAIGVKLAITGGERLIRPVLAVAIIALALRMLSLL